ncbi:MAG: hypothetical protein WCN98_18950, partial [Verrucomicrobiaceae bacterium]
MKGSFHVTAAAISDEAVLRDILRRTPLPGSVSVTLEREPSFFQGDADAQRHDVAVMHAADSRIVAFGSRIERRAWLNGEMQTVAYLSDLRVLPEHRKSSGRILIEGFRFMRELEATRPTAATYTAIFEDNNTARRVLVGGRAGLPQYVDRGRIFYPALLVRRQMRQPKSVRCGFRQATTSDLPGITIFLNNSFRHRDLAPVHSVEDFISATRWPGLRVEDFILAWDEDRLIGCVALWDLRACRQIRVQTYQGWMRRLRCVISFGMNSIGWQPLPHAGEFLPAAFASFLAVQDSDLTVARALLNQARYHASKRGIGFLFT